jgi:hypothetical protein
MQFNFPAPVWEPNPTDDGFTLRVPYIGLYYSPYSSNTWWFGFRGDQIGSRTDPMTEDELREMLYKKACRSIEDEYEIKTARVAQIEKLYGTP